MAELFTCRIETGGERLDTAAARVANITRSRAAALIRDGRVRVNGIVQSKAGFALKEGDEVAAELPDAAPPSVEAQDIALDILYQDDDLAVVYKPSGMVVHPAAGNPDGTMVNALLKHLDHLSGIGGEIRPGIVHRIDKDTSGLLLVAKNDFSHLSLSEQIRAHSVHRAYMAIVQGRMRDAEGTVDAPIGRHPTRRARCRDPLARAGGAARRGAARMPAYHRPYASDPRTYGVHRPSTAWGSGIRPKAHALSRNWRTAAARLPDRLRSSAYRRGNVL